MLYRNEAEARIDYGFDVTVWNRERGSRVSRLRDRYGHEVPYCWGQPAYWGIRAETEDEDLRRLAEAMEQLDDVYKPWTEYDMHEAVEVWNEFADAAWEFGYDVDIHEWDERD